MSKSILALTHRAPAMTMGSVSRPDQGYPGEVTSQHTPCPAPFRKARVNPHYRSGGFGQHWDLPIFSQTCRAYVQSRMPGSHSPGKPAGTSRRKVGCLVGGAPVGFRGTSLPVLPRVSWALRQL